MGNTRVLFADKDNDGLIRQSADQTLNEVLGFYNYSAFGLELGGSQLNASNNQNRFTYNGKEDIGFSGYLDYGFRMYDRSVGRFTGVDPISDQFPHLSTYNYADNSPIANIDLHGLQSFFAADGSVIHAGPLSNSSLQKRNLTPVINNPVTTKNGTSISGELAKGEISDKNNFGGFSLGGRLVGGSAYNNTESTALSIGAEASSISSNVGGQFGPDLLGLVGEAEGSFLSAEANLDAGLFLGEGDKVGPLLDANAGVYTVEGEISGGTSILGVKITYTAGGSLGSAHGGLTVGATYDKSTKYLTIEGFQHLGLGVGEKAGAKIEIPTFGIFDNEDK